MNSNITTTRSESIPEIQIGGRELILQEATRLFVRHGYNGISMREIAEACHMTKAALYYHFKDKEDLLRSIFTSYLDNLNRRFSGADHQTGSTRNRITNLINDIFEQSPEKRAVLHLMFVELPHLSKDLQQEIGSLYHSQFQGSIETILTQGIQKGEIRPTEPSIAARLLLGMMYPLFHPQNYELEKDIPESVNAMVKIFFEGVTPRK